VVDLSPRILHVTDSFPPEQGGVERVIDALAADQARRGWRPNVLTKATGDAPAFETRPDGVTVMRYPYSPRPTPLAYLTTWRATRRLAAGLRRCAPPDLIHYHLTLAAQGPLGLFGDSLPSVYSFYGPWHAEFTIEADPLLRQSGPAYRAYLQAQIAVQRRCQARLMRRVRRVVVLSEFSRGWVARLAPERAAGAVRIPGGIDPERCRPGDANRERRRAWGAPDDAFLLVSVRRLVRRMGLDMLLEAVARLRANGAKIFTLIAGQGALRAELEAHAAELGLADSTRFLGFVPDAELPELYHAADLFVTPSRAEENFGLIVLEAAACGAPVAATPSGSLPELLAATDPRYLAADITAAALAEAIARAMADGPAAREHWRSVVSPKVRAEFSWAAMADRLTALYGDLGVR